MDHSVKLWNNFLGLSKPTSPMYFLTGFHRKLSLIWLTTRFKMLLKMVQNCSNVWCFWMILLPWDERNTICLALKGYFSQNMGLIPAGFWFCIFFYFSKFLFQTSLKISQNLLLFWKKLWKHVLWQIYQAFRKILDFKNRLRITSAILKKASLIFFASVFIYSYSAG